MKIEMRCPNGHKEIIDDSRFSVPDSQKPSFRLSKGMHCVVCNKLWSEAYELVDVEVIK